MDACPRGRESGDWRRRATKRGKADRTRSRSFANPNKPSTDVRCRHVVSAFLDPGGNALESNFRGREAEIDNFDAVAARFPPIDAFHVGPSTQGALKGEISARVGQPIEFGKKHAAGQQVGHGGLEWGKSGGDQVGIHEM